MTMIKMGGVVAGLILVGLVGYGVGTAAQQAGQPTAVRRVGQVGESKIGKEGQTPPQASQDRKGTATEAELPAESPARVVSGVDGETTVIAIRRGLGMLVKKGDVIGELDSRQLRDQLIGQIAVVETAKAAYQNARLTREVAEIAVVEYQEGIFVQDLEEIEGEIKVAEAELALAEEVREAAKDDGPDKKLAIKRADLDIFRARTAIKKGQARRRVLVDYTKGRTLKQLNAEVQKARGDELCKQVIWELESQKQVGLERQIANCKIVAPIDGTIKRIAFNVGERVRGQQVLAVIVPDTGVKPQNP
jgi:multidrug resistance efflux pump